MTDEPRGLGLSRMIFGSSSFLPISEEEANDIKNAMEISFEISEVEQKFDLLISNFLEYEDELLSTSLRDSIRRINSFNDFFDMRLAFNRRVLNLLSAARLYRDQLNGHARNLFEDREGPPAIVSGWFSSEYDGDLAYRTMEAIRNYAQHRSLPLQGMTLQHDNVGEGEDWESRYNISLNEISKYFENDKKFNRRVYQELEEMGGKVDIKGYARIYIEAMSRVHAKFREFSAMSIEKSREKLTDAAGRFRSAFPQEDSIVGLAVVHVEEWPYRKEVRSIFFEQLEYADALGKRNRSLINLPRRVVDHRVYRKEK